MKGNRGVGHGVPAPIAMSPVAMVWGDDQSALFERESRISESEGLRSRNRKPKPVPESGRGIGMTSGNMYPVIMAGGAGTRLWPKSRQAVPKWSLRFEPGRTLIQAAWERAAAVAPPSNILAVTSPDQADRLMESLPDLPRDNCLVEPMMRDTAGCIALAAAVVAMRNPHGVMLVLPGDHVIKPLQSFVECARKAERLAAESRRLVAFGVVPRGPATSYGYIRRGAPIEGFGDGPEAFEIESFREKPDEETAREYVESGMYYWNAGIFAWTAETIIEEFRRQLPEHAEAVRQFMDAGRLGLDAAAITNYPKMRKISIDYGVMEGARRAAVVEADFEWDDIGSWSSARTHMPSDQDGNASDANALLLDTRGCLISADPRKQVVVIGVSELAIVDTPDALLICPLSRDQDVRKAVEDLRRLGRGMYL
ncbi:MAG: sugar phosphate nucleotidyltransferase [Planctomycetota bacterium]|nr:sugar phosphate nucleotidyltransferase [Planctomycetota bacterium]